MREPPEFSVRYYRRTYCDYPGCGNQAVADVFLHDADPHTGHAQVCGTHVGWGKFDLFKRDSQRTKE